MCIENATLPSWAECAEAINTLGAFLGRRDVPELSQFALQQRYGFRQADVMVLFGGSILCGVDVLARAMEQHVARKYVIVGGAGHTTEALRIRARQEFPGLETANLSEAEVFQSCLFRQYGLRADWLECASTNCGNNITHLLSLLRAHSIGFRSVILTQDATMQLRMDATMRNFVPDDTIIVNYAAYSASVSAAASGLTYVDEIRGMWRMERYITLLMGEIPRLTDDESGYGPRGKRFIAHVDIPASVRDAFALLKRRFADSVREANPAFRSQS